MVKHLAQRVGQARGQSTLEYILVLAAVLLALIFAAGNFIQPGVRSTVERAGDTMTSAAGHVATGLGL